MERNAEIKIKVSKYLSVDLSIPTEIDLIDFLGMVEQMRKLGKSIEMPIKEESQEAEKPKENAFWGDDITPYMKNEKFLDEFAKRKGMCYSTTSVMEFFKPRDIILTHEVAKKISKYILKERRDLVDKYKRNR